MIPALLFEYMQNYRVLWIAGRVGYGKTLLAYALWWEYYRPRGYNLYCNFEAFGAETGLPSEPRGFYIIDEAGDIFESSAHLRSVLRNMRKLDYYLVLPSFLPVPGLGRMVALYPSGSLRTIGIPVDFWKVAVDFGAFKFQQQFAIFLKEQYFGLFDSYSLVSKERAYEIISLLSQFSGYSAKVSSSFDERYIVEIS